MNDKKAELYIKIYKAINWIINPIDHISYKAYDYKFNKTYKVLHEVSRRLDCLAEDFGEKAYNLMGEKAYRLRNKLISQEIAKKILRS